MQETAARARTRRTLKAAAAVGLVVTAAVAGTLASRSASSSASAIGAAGSPGALHAAPPAASTPATQPSELPRRNHSAGTTTQTDAISSADGALPDGATVFDDRYPGIANLDPDLGRALRDAARAAADDGIELHVNSGWRSPAYQGRLLRAAVAEYGSEREAARWVATPDTSPHVSGDAVDLGPAAATGWLAEHGAGYGLCRIYRNEPWHFELRPTAMDRGCPDMYADPAHDPRLR